MKKIILIGGLLLSFGASAASFNWTWTAGGLYTYSSTADSKSSFSGTVYLYAVINGVKTEVDTYQTSNGRVLGTNSDGKFSIEIATTTDELGNEKSIYDSLDFFFEYSSEGNTYTSASKNSTVLDASKTQSLNWATVNTVANGTWTTAAVPEPTSGLLLLLGMAGLALRRKKA